MKIILGADHRGFQLKQELKQHFPDFTDVGAFSYQSDDDYIDYAAQAVAELGEGDRAILVCGSGHGMDITANRFSHIRAIVGFNADVVKQGREHEDANVLIIPSDWTALDPAIQLVNLFLSTPFLNESRHLRRLEKLNQLAPKT